MSADKSVCEQGFTRGMNCRAATYRGSTYFTIDSDALRVLPGSQLLYTSTVSDDAAAVSADKQSSEATDIHDSSHTVERGAASC